MIAIVDLGVGQLTLAAALILVNAMVSAYLSLGLGRSLLIAAVRSVVQLLLIGLVLSWVFASGPWAVAAVAAAMAAIAGLEAVRRTSRRSPGIYGLSIGVMIASSMLVTIYGVSAVIRVRPWYEAQYFIPVLGMVLGNTLNGISLGLETVLDGFDRDRERVELLLAHGASRWEASREVIRRSVRTGMIPILNSMAAAGIVSIPGMMTGQILSGEDPQSAARYQIFILFAIAGGVALGTVAVVLGATRLLFDERGRLRSDRIQPHR